MSSIKHISDDAVFLSPISLSYRMSADAATTNNNAPLPSGPNTNNTASGSAGVQGSPRTSAPVGQAAGGGGGGAHAFDSFTWSSFE